MTVGELKTILAKFDDDMRVVFLSDVGCEDVQTVEISPVELGKDTLGMGHMTIEENDNTIKCVIIS